MFQKLQSQLPQPKDSISNGHADLYNVSFKLIRPIFLQQKPLHFGDSHNYVILEKQTH